jgi:hypothetical protein
MSRIRTVKPELFKHEDLFDAEQNSKLPLRLAFIGLFTVADREGRFKWRPRTLKLDVLPHDFIDFAAVLDALERAGFIERYEVGGETYGWIPTFTKHQRFSGKESEAKSQLPPPPPQGSTGEVPGKHPDASPTLPNEATGKQEGIQEWSKERSRGREWSEGTDAAPARPARAPKTPLPADLAITPELQAWANEHGYGDLAAHLEHFRDKATAHGYQYADWMAALRNAIRDDWAGLRKQPVGATTPHDPPLSPLSKAGEQQRQNLAVWLQQDPKETMAHELH